MLFICITGIIAAAIGCGIGYILRKRLAEAKIGSAEAKAQQIAADAKRLLDNTSREAQNLKKEAMMQTREEIHKLREDVEKENRERRDELQKYEQRLVQKEEHLDRRSTTLEEREDDLSKKTEQLKARQTEVDAVYEQQRARLEEISQMTQSEARTMIMDKVDSDLTHEKAVRIREAEADIKADADQIARKILATAIQRNAADTVSETTVSVVSLPNEEMKGRIIGREGRNIRALEAATGVEIVVDDTPEAIVLSAFDPVRREIARLALHQLVTDGRIHPARIEEVVAKVRKQVEEEIIETGKRTTIDLGIHGLHPELIRIIGKMKYRSSYGQNLLQHARETANLCAVMASELGLNPKKAKRAGLLHDIGKVPDEEPELPHALLGMKLAEKYKEKPDICNAIGAHHDETEMTSLLAPIVQVCDAISGARPGARREIVEAYIKRLNDLEQLAMAYPGVTKTYAIQAGRELRVIVGADKIDDKQTESLSGEIAKKIQDEMTYPGQVKITVIRETRAVSFAK